MGAWHRSIGIVAILAFSILVMRAPLQAGAQTGDTGWVYDDGCALYQENGAFAGQIDCPRPANEGWGPGCYQLPDGSRFRDGTTVSGLGCADTSGGNQVPGADPSSVAGNAPAGSNGTVPSNTPVPQQSLPANGCPPGSNAPEYACPVTSQASSRYIQYVKAVPGGMSVLLTPAGIEMGNRCGGPAKLVDMAHELYQTIPPGQRASADIDWESRQLEDEFHAHAYFAKFPEETTWIGVNFARSGNPIDVSFADYTDLPGRDPAQRGQQVVFNYLGDAHRLRCRE